MQLANRHSNKCRLLHNFAAIFAAYCMIHMSVSVLALPAARCDDERLLEQTDKAFRTFAAQVIPCWRSRMADTEARKRTETISVDGLRALMAPNTKPQCFAEMIVQHLEAQVLDVGVFGRRITTGLMWYKVSGNAFVHDSIAIGRILGTHPVCDRTVTRVQAIRIALQSIWGMLDPQNRINSGFRFWFDYTAGSAIPQQMYDYLYYPVLTPGRSPEDRCSFPVPHVYFYMAIVGSSLDLLYTYARAAPAREVPFAMEMYAVLGDSAAKDIPKWESKKAVAVYRGSCFPTANPDPTGPGYLLLRGGLCQKANEVNKPYLDVGTGIKAEYVQDGPSDYCQGRFFQPLCDGCRPCNNTSPLDREQMMKYKYQISVEGYGPTADAIYWKLKSNSVVMHVVPNALTREPYYVAWFWPLLKADEHYMPVTLDELPAAVERCLQNDEHCRKIAERAQELSLCELSLRSQALYVTKILQLMQQLSEDGRRSL